MALIPIGASRKIRPSLRSMGTIMITMMRNTTLHSATTSTTRTWKCTESSGTSLTLGMSAVFATQNVRSCDARGVMYRLVPRAKMRTDKQFTPKKLESGTWLSKLQCRRQGRVTVWGCKSRSIRVLASVFPSGAKIEILQLWRITGLEGVFFFRKYSFAYSRYSR